MFPVIFKLKITKYHFLFNMFISITMLNRSSLQKFQGNKTAKPCKKKNINVQQKYIYQGKNVIIIYSFDSPRDQHVSIASIYNNEKTNAFL